MDNYLKKDGWFRTAEVSNLLALIDTENPLLERLDPPSAAIICVILLRADPCPALSRATYLLAVGPKSVTWISD